MRKIKTDYGSEAIYKYYCKKTNNPKSLTQREFTDITKKFFTAIFDELIYKGREFLMPGKLGCLRVKKSKIKISLTNEGKIDSRRLAPNWAACRRIWKEKWPNLTMKELKEIPNKPMIYHTNRHTDGYKHKWHWDKTTCLVKNNTAYTLEITRNIDRKLSKALQKEELQLDYSLF